MIGTLIGVFATETDKNLLFGVLAVQLDLIDAQQLSVACAEWAARRDEPVGAILVERGWIDEEDRKKVDELLSKKLESYGGDAHLTLAAEAKAELLDAIRAVEDDELQHSLDTLPPVAGRVLEETMDDSPTHGSRYSLTRLHAEGGLGRVWVARDSELQRDVALKELRPAQVDKPEAWRRFLKEAQITGQLEHPNIVPVYEMGRREDDDHLFYTMRLVRGETLREAIRDYHHYRQRSDAETRDLRQLLDIFVNVCQAIGYAHSRGVIHRDLKPENIVLGKFGEVIVLDWGLARVSLADAGATTIGISDATTTDATQHGVILGTPAYMSPEQAEGNVERIDARSDIYELGAVLFEILTGVPPHRGHSPSEVIQNIIANSTPRARDVCSDVSPALDAICAKAMAKEPSQRYERSMDLAQDVRRWLGDEPVSAFSDPITIRFARWGRRHRTAVASALALMTAAVVALTVGTALLQRANQRTERQRQISDQNFQMARKAVDEYLTKVAQDPRLKAQSLDPLRRDLLETARDFYEGLLEREPDSLELRAEHGRAYLRLGLITDGIGKVDDTLNHYTRARDIFLALLKAHPGVAEFEDELARSYHGLGIAFFRTKKLSEARDAFLAAVKHWQPLGEQDDSIYTLSLGRAYNGLGLVHQELQNLTEAEEWYGKAQDVFRVLADSNADALVHHLSVAAIYNNLGYLNSPTNPKQAIEHYHAAIAIHESQPFPDSPEYLKQYALTQLNLGWLYANSGQEFDTASKCQQEAHKAWSRLVEQHPDVHEYTGQSANSLALRGKLNAIAGRTAEAQLDYELCLEVYDRLAERYPDVDMYSQKAASIHYLLAWTYDHDQVEKALDEFESAESYYRKLVDSHPKNATHKWGLAWALSDQGAVQNRLGQRQQSIASFEEAASIFRDLTAVHAENYKYKVDRARLMENFGFTRFQHKDYSNSLAAYEEALSIRKILRDRLGGVHRLHLADTHSTLGYVHSAAEQFGKAVASYESALAIRLQLVEERPDDVSVQAALRQTYFAIAKANRRAGRHDQSKAAYLQAIAAAERLAVLTRQSPGHVAEVGACHNNFGYGLKEMGEFEAAVERLTTAIKYLSDVLQKSPDNGEAKQYLRTSYENRGLALEKLNRYPEALTDWNRALELASEAKRPEVLLGRGTCHARFGEIETAVADVETAIDLQPDDADRLYDAARVYSISADVVSRNQSLSEQQRSSSAQEYVQRAIDFIERARDKKLFDDPDKTEQLRKNSDFQAIRSSELVREIVDR